MQIKYNKHWEIETPEGFKDFDGVALIPKKVKLLKFTLEDGKQIEVSYGHTFIIDGMEEIAIDLIVGECLDTKQGLKKITNIDFLEKEDYVLDILEVKSSDHSYYLNDIVNRNCKFLGSTKTLIDPDLLERIEIKDPTSLKYGDLMKIYETPEPGEMYILGVDSAKGIAGDYSVIQVLKITDEHDLKQVAVYRNNLIDTYNFSQICIGVSEYYNGAYMMVENNAEGGEVANTIWYNFEYDKIINCDRKGIGVRSTKKSKLAANLMIKRYMENGWLEIMDQDTIMELSRYEETSPNVFKAAQYDHDDCVTSLLWALYFLSTAAFDGKNIDVHKISDEFKVDSSDEPPIMIIDEGTELQQ